MNKQTNMKKALTAIILCLSLVLTGCDFNGIYNDNSRLIKTADSISQKNAVRNRTGNEFTYTGTMTGMTTIWRLDVPDDTQVSLSFYLSVSEGGKAKLVLVTADDKVSTIVENAHNVVDTNLRETTVSLKRGANRIKLVGYDAPKVELKLIG